MKVRPLSLSRKMSVDGLMREYGKGVFGADRIAEAADIYEKMVLEGATIFLGLSGAMIPAGMKKILCTLIEKKMIHVIVSTGANVTHDLIEAFGGTHLKGVSGTDTELRKRGIDRIYDAFVEDRAFALFEKRISPILADIFRTSPTLSASEFIFQIGRRVKARGSLLRTAYRHNVPIFVPALSDSVLGLQTFLFQQEHKLFIDEMRDIGKIIDIASVAQKTGVLILGGGVPKNFILQTMLMLPRVHDYAIQITTTTPENGGLSGATLGEAISWGKVSEKSRLCTVYADVTIAFPLIVGAVIERLGKRGYL